MTEKIVPNGPADELPDDNDLVTAAEEIPADTDPFALFGTWLEEARAGEPNDFNAMTLATATSDGRPSARMVLMKAFDTDGFVFYTNLESRKGEELRANPEAALLFHWKSLRRQVRIEGPVVPVDDAEADAYFASRPRGSRIGAWASQQSRPMAARSDLLSAVARTAARYGLGTIPRPPHWSGFRLVPRRLEFWRDRPFRLHERLVCARTESGDGWTVARLYP